MEATNPYAFQNTIRECGAQIAANMSYEERLQLLSFLAQIARSDGNVCAAEIDALKEVAQSMQLSAKEVESMLNLSGNSLEEAYKVLEVEPTATDDLSTPCAETPSRPCSNIGRRHSQGCRGKVPKH